MKEHPILFSGEMVNAILEGRKTQTRRVITERWQLCRSPEDEPEIFINWCPYGQPGYRLWVREKLDMWPGDIFYSADGEFCEIRDWDWFNNWHRAYCPSIHMPRWASRITLEIVNVRVERVQEISPSDCFAEGLVTFTKYDDPVVGGIPTLIESKSPIQLFPELWDSINAKRGYSWENNPWVWVIEFKKIGG